MCLNSQVLFCGAQQIRSTCSSTTRTVNSATTTKHISKQATDIQEDEFEDRVLRFHFLQVRETAQENSPSERLKIFISTSALLPGHQHYLLADHLPLEHFLTQERDSSRAFPSSASLAGTMPDPTLSPCCSVSAKLSSSAQN